MSRKATCLDNAVAENFFGLLKTELFYLEKFDSLDQLEKQVIDRRVNIMKAEGIDFLTCADVGGSTRYKHSLSVQLYIIWQHGQSLLKMSRV